MLTPFQRGMLQAAIHTLSELDEELCKLSCSRDDAAVAAGDFSTVDCISLFRRGKLVDAGCKSCADLVVIQRTIKMLRELK